jgi:hypothetical protein
MPHVEHPQEGRKRYRGQHRRTPDVRQDEDRTPSESVYPHPGEETQGQRGNAPYRGEYANLGGRSVKRYDRHQGNGYEAYLGAKLGNGVRSPQPQEVAVLPKPWKRSHSGDLSRHLVAPVPCLASTILTSPSWGLVRVRTKSDG